ncbi:MAG: Rieske (2Fe-2S) protein [Sandaracinaceae bacterium]|nr:Rieske (2Fe-2S) protein [Sandaracinaceae bacterium]
MSESEGTSSSRRKALKALIALGAAAWAAAVLVPGVSYLLHPLKRRAGDTGRWKRVAKLREVPGASGMPVAVPVIGEQVDAWTRAPAQRLGTIWLRKKSDTEVIALQAECPHLGCSIQLDAEHRRFACPCHESFFDLEGRCTAGPSPRGMDPLATRVRDGQVEVDFKRFRTQTRNRTSLG